MVDEGVEKVGFSGLWKSLEYNEKVFMITSVTLVVIVWLINTLSGFIG